MKPKPVLIEDYIDDIIKKIKINISEKKEKCLRYRHNLKQKKRLFGRAQNITMPKY